MQKESAIIIRNLKIDYRNLNHLTIQQIIKNPALKSSNVLHALKGIDLEIKKGEVVGIIGPNGAGKSTLLKAIAGIFQPDHGSIDTCGLRVSLMSLGVGFKWDLSGRDNIMIAGLLLRYPAAYIKEKMQEIISFAELEKEIDRPVRTYSSGMYSKLSFAITAVLETDIMLVDELLSVGDEKFQEKSFARIRSLVKSDNMTGVIVSHDMDLVKDICDRVVWMHEGRIIASGKPEDIVNMYVRWSRVQGAEKLQPADHLDELTEQETRIPMFRGITVDSESGLLKQVSPNDIISPFSVCVNWEPVRIKKGARIRRKDPSALAHVFWYSEQIPLEFIYTSLSSSEGVEMEYKGFSSDESLMEWVCPADCCVRICLRKLEGGFPSDPYMEDYLEISDNTVEHGLPPFLEDELKQTVCSWNQLKQKDDFTFLLLADSHVSFGKNWTDTASALKELSKKISLDAVIHLGDISDGALPALLNKRLVKRVLKDLNDTGVPVYLCPGNHDLDSLPVEFYLHQKRTGYYVDDQDHNIRMVFLTGYDPRRDPSYGFSNEDLSWLERVLSDTPDHCCVLFFSHICPFKERTNYQETVLNAKALMDILKNFDHKTKRLLGAFYGHEHRDVIYTEYSFPVIGQNCSKTENCTGEYPLHSGRFFRVQGKVSQELFDVVIVKPEMKEMELIRFGAGDDRHVNK